MVDYIISQVDSGTEIKIYLDHAEAGTPESDIVKRNKELKQLAAGKQLKITIYSYNCNTATVSYHDRKIFLSKDHIRFSKGFDCLPPKLSRTVSKGELEISHKQSEVDEGIESILQQHPGYYEVWNNQMSAEA